MISPLEILPGGQYGEPEIAAVALTKDENNSLANQRSAGFSAALLREIPRTFKYNIYYQVYRDEWHSRQFENPADATIFCRNLNKGQIYRIFHQVSVLVGENTEIIARRIDLQTCEQMANDKNAFDDNNAQTALKLFMKISNPPGRRSLLPIA